MKKILCLLLSAMVVLMMLIGCDAAENPSSKAPSGKIVINFEGSIASVEENGITLENGQLVLFDDETVFSDANGTVVDVKLEVGDFIQGHTADDPDAAEISATRVHIVK